MLALGVAVGVVALAVVCGVVSTVGLSVFGVAVGVLVVSILWASTLGVWACLGAFSAQAGSDKMANTHSKAWLIFLFNVVMAHPNQ